MRALVHGLSNPASLARVPSAPVPVVCASAARTRRAPAAPCGWRPPIMHFPFGLPASAQGAPASLAPARLARDRARRQRRRRTMRAMLGAI